ncbi:MAG TPA: hypothetical protein VF332_12430 [Vicinamibacterales bacterium]
MSEGCPLTIAELLTSDELLHSHEAVAIAVELCSLIMARRPVNAVAPAISSSSVSIDASGAVAVAGGVPGEDEQAVSLIGRLLVDMLGHAGNQGESAVPTRLRATAVRAATSGHEAFESLANLVAALRRHAPAQRHAAIRAVFDRRRAAARRSASSRAPGFAPAGLERRRRCASADIVPGELRAAEQEVLRARFAGQERQTGVERKDLAGAARASRNVWITRALVVGAMLLLLAGVSAIFQFTDQGDEAPTARPVTRPTPASPPREPGWELLGKPERASVAPAPGAALPNRPATMVPPPTVAPPPELSEPARSAPAPRQPER